MFNLISIYYFT